LGFVQILTSHKSLKKATTTKTKLLKVIPNGSQYKIYSKKLAKQAYNNTNLWLEIFIENGLLAKALVSKLKVNPEH